METVGEVIEMSADQESQNQSTGDLVLQCPSPYSDISDRSMLSDKSLPDNFSVDKISSDDELDDISEAENDNSNSHFEDAKAEEHTPQGETVTPLLFLSSVKGGEQKKEKEEVEIVNKFDTSKSGEILLPPGVTEEESSPLLEVNHLATVSEPASPKSRVSILSKSVLSQDDLESASSVADEKR